MRKESVKEWRYINVYVYVHIYIYDLIFCIPLTNTTLYLNYTPIKILKEELGNTILHISLTLFLVDKHCTATRERDSILSV